MLPAADEIRGQNLSQNVHHCVGNAFSGVLTFKIVCLKRDAGSVVTQLSVFLWRSELQRQVSGGELQSRRKTQKKGRESNQ